MSPFAQTAHRPQPPVLVEPQAVAGVGALEEGGVERQHAAGPQHLADRGDHLGLVRYEVDRVAEDYRVHLRHQAAQALRGPLDEPHDRGLDPLRRQQQRRRGGVYGKDAAQRRQAHALQDEFGDGARAAAQVNDIGARPDPGPGHQPGVHFPEKRVGRELGKREPRVRCLHV